MLKTHQILTELPLTAGQTEHMLQAAIQEVRRTVVARRVMALFGPVGAGVESVPLERIEKDDPAEIDLEGKPDSKPIRTHEHEQYIRVPIIYKDFLLHWRDVKWSQDMNSPLDVSNAVRAAHQVGDAEDNLLLNGRKDLDVKGLMTCPGSHKVNLGNWSKDGTAVSAVYAAIDKLLSSNHHFPYALITSVDMYRELLKPVKDSPVWELEQVSKVCTDGVFWSPQIKEGTAAVVSTGVQNFDVAVAEDLQIAYLGPRDMNYCFRVYESMVPRIKRSSAICIIEGR